MALETDPRTLNVSSFAPVFGHFGYAIHARSTLLALRGYVKRLHVRPSMPPTSCPCDDCTQMKLHVKTQQPMPRPDCHIAILPAQGFYQKPCTSFLFTTVESWVAHHTVVFAAAQWDHVIVPTAWTADSLLRGGVPHDRLSVVPEAIHSSFSAKPPTAQETAPLEDLLFPNPNARSGVRVLYLGDYSSRKSVRELAFAFGLANKQRPDLFLTMAACPGGRRDSAATTEAQQEAKFFVRQAHPPAVDNFNLTTTFIPFKDQRLAYYTAPVYVHAGRGEAWNLTVGEAYATGALVVAPSFGGHVEFLTDHDWLPVDSSGLTSLDQPNLVKVFHHQNVPFFSIDICHLTTQLVKAYDVTRANNMERHAPRKQFTRDYSWSNAGRLLADTLARHYRKEHHVCNWNYSPPYSFAPRYLSPLSVAPYGVSRRSSNKRHVPSNYKPALRQTSKSLPLPQSATSKRYTIRT